MGDAATMTETESSAAARKRKRSAQGCMCEENDVLVEELKKVKAKVRDPTSHLASNYMRAISSIMHHDAPIRDGKQAKTLKNIGNYLANQIQAILQKKGLLRPAAVSSDGGNSSSSRNGATVELPSHLQRIHKQQHKHVSTTAVATSVTATTVLTQAAALAAPIATRVTSEVAHKVYAPAYRKRKWTTPDAVGAELLCHGWPLTVLRCI